MAKGDKNYIKGSFREVESKFGQMIIMSVNVDDLVKIANERGYANVVLTARREPDQYGNTHNVYENTFQPDKEKGAQRNKAKSDAMNAPNFQESVGDGDDLPF